MPSIILVMDCLPTSDILDGSVSTEPSTFLAMALNCSRFSVDPDASLMDPAIAETRATAFWAAVNFMVSNGWLRATPSSVMEDTYSCWYFASSADVSRCICAICLDISPRIGSISATASWRAMRFLALNRLTYSSSWSSLISVISWISAAAFGPSSCNSSRRSSPMPRRSRSLRFLRHCFNPST